MPPVFEPLIPATLGFDENGTLISDIYDDIYHAAAGAIGQAEWVFINGNRLTERWFSHHNETFTIVETGFGAGLNFLATWRAWRTHPRSPHLRRLHFISVEKHPFTTADLAAIHRRWPELADLSARLLAQWPALLPGFQRLEFADEGIVLTLVFGDGPTLLKEILARVDAFYLDGFAPQKNPHMWAQPVFSALARLAIPEATLSTWSVAGEVRRGLRQAGFVCEKTPGYADKNAMLAGTYQPWPSSRRRDKPIAREKYLGDRKHALIIGAGIAGSSVANCLAHRGWRVEVFEEAPSPGSGASGNLAGIMRPHLSVDDNPLARLSRAAFLYALRHLKTLQSQGYPLRWKSCGVVHLARTDEHERVLEHAVHALEASPQFVTYLDRQTASRLVGWPVAHGGWFFPQGGWVSPQSLCHANLEHPAIELRSGCKITAIDHTDGLWQIGGPDANDLASAPVLILANGIAARTLIRPLPLRSARGQVSHLHVKDLPWIPDLAVCGQGYLTGPIDGVCCIGASFRFDDDDCAPSAADSLENLDKLTQMLPGLPVEQACSDDPPDRVGFRPVSLDRIPMLGQMPDFVRIRQSDESFDLKHLPRQPGLYLANGFGTRGIVWSALAGELLASLIDDDPLPVEKDLVEATDPGRYLVRPIWKKRLLST